MRTATNGIFGYTESLQRRLESSATGDHPSKTVRTTKKIRDEKVISDTSQAEWVLEHTVPGTTVDFGGYRAEKIFVIVDETFDRTGFPNISREICNQLFSLKKIIQQLDDSSAH